MRVAVVTLRLPHVPLPRLEEIGAALMSVPNPRGHTFESLMPCVEDGREKEMETRH